MAPPPDQATSHGDLFCEYFGRAGLSVRHFGQQLYELLFPLRLVISVFGVRDFENALQNRSKILT